MSADNCAPVPAATKKPSHDVDVTIPVPGGFLTLTALRWAHNRTEQCEGCYQVSGHRTVVLNDEVLDTVTFQDIRPCETKTNIVSAHVEPLMKAISDHKLEALFVKALIHRPGIPKPKAKPKAKVDILAPEVIEDIVESTRKRVNEALNEGKAAAIKKFRTL